MSAISLSSVLTMTDSNASDLTAASIDHFDGKILNNLIFFLVSFTLPLAGITHMFLIFFSGMHPAAQYFTLLTGQKPRENGY